MNRMFSSESFHTGSHRHSHDHISTSQPLVDNKSSNEPTISQQIDQTIHEHYFLILSLITIGVSIILLLICLITILIRRNRANAEDEYQSLYQPNYLSTDSHFIGLNDQLIDPVSASNNQANNPSIDDLLTAKLWVDADDPTSSGHSNRTPKQSFNESNIQTDEMLESHLLIASMIVRSFPHDCEILTAFPMIGHRSARSYFSINDRKINQIYGNQTLTQTNKQSVNQYNQSTYIPSMLNLMYTQSMKTTLLYSSKTILSLIERLLSTLIHPSLLPIWGFAESQQGRYIATVSPLSNLGSLRDYQHSALFSQAYSVKYFTADGVDQKPGRPLSLTTLRVFARQILQGVRYLSDAGLAAHTLHSGNVILVRGSSGSVRCCISHEGLMLGFKSRMHRRLKMMRSVDPIMCAIAFLLYEMATGIEAQPTSKDVVDLTIADPQYSEVQDLIEGIMNNQYSSINELLNHSLTRRGPMPVEADDSQLGAKPKIESKLVRKIIQPLMDYYSKIYRRHPQVVGVINQSSNHTVKQSSNQPETVTVSITDSSNQSINRSLNQSINQSPSRSSNLPSPSRESKKSSRHKPVV